MSNEATEFSRIQNRIDTHRKWLKENAPECFTEQKHCVEGTQERVYWHYGYMVALVDALNLLTGSSK
jgi:hypothetical protein